MNSSFADSTPPLVVVGSGLAGLFLALHAVEQGPVLIITKTALLDGSTRHAQGGLAAALAEGDTVASHVTDTLVAGAGLCDIDAVETICAEGPRRVRELMDFGVNFDTTDGALQFGREGAHSVNRVIHAGGDATGAHIIDVLAARVAGEPRITVREHTRVVDICVEHGRAAGVFLEDGERVEARAVVLATGGSGHLFARTTNPVGATADGSALAHRAGAMLTDLEFVQFHPTALAFGASPLALVSEAVRGEGAYLRDAHGRRFMLDLHPQAELGPRDVVARAIARQAAIDGVDVTLDLRHLDRDGVLNHFPTVAAACRVHGLDLATDPIPVTPAVHYAMGGVFTDSSGRTTVPDLWAVGECASTGAHGANRLASNSLLEAAVMAGRAAEHLANQDGWPTDNPGHTTAPRRLHADTRAVVQQANWDGAGVERDADSLGSALHTLSDLPSGDSIECANLAEVGQLMVRAAILREESRGGHYRSDFPDTDDAFLHRIAWVNGEPIELPITRTHILERVAR